MKKSIHTWDVFKKRLIFLCRLFYEILTISPSEDELKKVEFAVTALAVFMAVLIYMEVPLEEFIANGGEVIGVIHKNSSDMTVHYSINNKNFSVSYYFDNSIEHGERYYLSYDKKNVENIRIQFWRPYIPYNELTNYVDIKCEEVIYAKSYYVKFIYYYDGVKYIRTQYTPFKKSITVGSLDNRKIRVNKKNPKISYIFW